MTNSPKREATELSVAASNTDVFERRQHDRRISTADSAVRLRRKRLGPEVWWIAATFTMLAAGFLIIWFVA
jgi:hypothetical protein